MANQCIFPRSFHPFILDEKPTRQGNQDEQTNVLFSSSTCSSSLSSYSSEQCNDRSKRSFLQRCIHFKDRQHASLLESRYGQLQNGVVGRGTYATVRLIKSRNHHSNSTAEKIHADLTPTAEFYAVKIFKKVKRTEHHGKYMKRLISEYCIASSINHPNIVKTWDLITDVSNRYCIVMEFCSGGDLYHAIKKNRVTWTKMNSYFKQLLLGLDYLHSLGVAHRDIKPENLLLSGDGSILKITDFGVADVFCETWQRHSRLSDGFCGSLAFIAPEVFVKTGKKDNVILSCHLSKASSSTTSSSSSVRKTLKSDLGYQGSKVDVWSAAIVYCCMYFKGTIFASAQSSDPYYRAYLNTFYSRSFVPFAPLEDSKMSSVLYQMLDPDPDRRLSASQLLSIPFISNIQ